MRIDKLRMGEAWIKEDDATSQEAKDTKMAIELAGEAAGEVGTSLTKPIDSIKGAKTKRLIKKKVLSLISPTFCMNISRRH